MPIIEDLATKHKGQVGKVNCDKLKGVCSEFKVASYPTIAV